MATRQLPSNIIFILDSREQPYLPEILKETEAMGISVRLIDGKAEESPAVGANDFIVTDSIAGAELARKAGTGYVAFVQGELSRAGFWDAQCVIQGFDEVDGDFIVKMYERARNIPWTILETERTILRELTLDDIDDLYKLYAQPGMADYIPPLCEDREEEVEFEKMYIKSMYGFYGYGIWVILDRETGKFIGRAGVTHREGFEDLEVGYMLSREYQHKGIASEVMRAVIDYAAKKYGSTRLNAFIDERNTSSVRFAERLGFKKNGKAMIEGSELDWYVLITN